MKRETVLLGAVALAALMQPGLARGQVTIQGFVTDAAGAPIAGSDIDLFDAGSGVKIDLGGQDDNTDPSGFYSLTVSPDIYHVRAEPPIARTDLAPVQIRDVILDVSKSVDLSLPRGRRLSGRVLGADGQPAVGVDLDLVDPTSGVKAPTVRDDTDGDGFYALTVAPGIWHVDFSPPPGSATGPKRVEAVDLGSDRTLDVTLPRGFRATGIVRTPTGAGLFRADLDARERETRRVVPTSNDATDFSGAFDFVLPEGMLDVFVLPPPTAPFAPLALYNVAISGDTDFGTLTLEAGTVFAGTVRDGAGTPIAGVDLDFFVAGTCDRFPVVDGFTAADGSFRTRVAPGTYDVLVVPPDAAVAPWLVPDVDLAADQSLDLTPALGAPTTVAASRVVDEEGAGRSDVRVSGLPLESGFNWEAMTAADGSFSVDVEPGVYAVTVTPPDDSGLAPETLPRVFLPCELPAAIRLATAIATGSGRGLVEAWPNPWGDETDLALTLPGAASRARLDIYDLAGRRVRTLHQGALSGGIHVIRWDGTNEAGRPVASGIYFVRLEHESGSSSTKTLRIAP